MPIVILMNGVGSVGKSSIAREFQNLSETPFLHLEMDNFLRMMPERFLGHPEGLQFVEGIEDGKPATFAKVGAVARCVLTGMRHAAAEMARAGNNLIIDEVLFGNTGSGSAEAVSEYCNLMKPYDFFSVGVFASLRTIEEREHRRGDRTPGLARWQYDRVHEQMEYDFTIDAEHNSPRECARLIKERLRL